MCLDLTPSLAPSPDTVCVLLDYAIPAYRDLRTGRFVFGQLVPRWRAEGITRVMARGGDRTHERYLGRMGFGSASASTCSQACAGRCRERRTAEGAP